MLDALLLLVLLAAVLTGFNFILKGLARIFSRQILQGVSYLVVGGVLLAPLIMAIAPPSHDHTHRGGFLRNTRQKQMELSTAIDNFKADCGNYPTIEHGLLALVVKPDDVTGWKGPYIKSIPVDAWNSPFHYALKENGYEIRSAGPDCKLGTEDDFTN